MEFLLRYWPGLLGAILVGYFGVKLATRPEPEGPLPVLEPSQVEDGDDRGASTLQVDPMEPAPPREPEIKPTPQEPETELRETLIAVPSDENDRAEKTYTQDSPEVQQALSSLPVEVYAPPGSESAEQASAFFKKNGITAQVHDTDDVMAKERARRLTKSASPNSDVLVIVVDGQVLTGFSESQVQDVVTEAVKKRVLAAQ